MWDIDNDTTTERQGSLVSNRWKVIGSRCTYSRGGRSLPLHSFAEEIWWEEGVEGGGAVVLIVGGAPHGAAQPGTGPEVATAQSAAAPAPRVHGGGLGEAGEGGVGRGGGGAPRLVAAAWVQGADDVLYLVLVRHSGQDGCVTQHTVVQGVLSLQVKQRIKKIV